MIEPIPDEPIPESVLANNPRALTYEQFYRIDVYKRQVYARRH